MRELLSRSGAHTQPWLVARQPRAPGASSRRRSFPEQDLQDLARWPNEAHKAWKRLSTPQRDKVVELMKQRYGETFAMAFQTFAKSGATDRGEPATRIYHTPAWFHARGYQLAEQAGGAYGEIAGQWPWQQWWVHPSGTVIYQQFGSSPRKGQPGSAGDSNTVDDDPDPFSDDLVDCQQQKDAIQDLKDQLKSLNSKSAQYAQLYRKYAQLLKALETKLTATMEKIDKVIDDPSVPKKVKDARSADWHEFNEVKFWVDQETDPQLDPAATGHEAAPRPPGH